MNGHESRYDTANRLIRNALDDSNLDARVKIGGEQFHPDMGHYFRHDRLTVKGDMNDPMVLKEVSRLCDAHGLEVDGRHGQPFTGEDYAILRVDWDEYE